MLRTKLTSSDRKWSKWNIRNSQVTHGTVSIQSKILCIISKVTLDGIMPNVTVAPEPHHANKSSSILDCRVHRRTSTNAYQLEPLKGTTSLATANQYTDKLSVCCAVFHPACTDMYAVMMYTSLVSTCLSDRTSDNSICAPTEAAYSGAVIVIAQSIQLW